jgi:hypothetical protein
MRDFSFQWVGFLIVHHRLTVSMIGDALDVFDSLDGVLMKMILPTHDAPAAQAAVCFLGMVPGPALRVLIAEIAPS